MSLIGKKKSIPNFDKVIKKFSEKVNIKDAKENVKRLKLITK